MVIQRRPEDLFTMYCQGCVPVCQGEDYLWVPICKGCSPYWWQRWENIVPVRILERVRFRRACASRRLYHVHIVLCDLY